MQFELAFCTPLWAEKCLSGQALRVFLVVNGVFNGPAVVETRRSLPSAVNMFKFTACLLVRRGGYGTAHEARDS